MRQKFLADRRGFEKIIVKTEALCASRQRTRAGSQAALPLVVYKRQFVFSASNAP
jgi:hypothetical protein